MPDPLSADPRASRPADESEAASDDRGAGKAAFLGGLLAVTAIVSLSVAGLGHARTIAGAANAQYWIVTAAVAAAYAFVGLAFARTHARSRTGETLRRATVPVAALWFVVFVWEAAAVGAGAFPGPFELVWAAWKG